jgi:hypothetical protein
MKVSPPGFDGIQEDLSVTPSSPGNSIKNIYTNICSESIIKFDLKK